MSARDTTGFSLGGALGALILGVLLLGAAGTEHDDSSSTGRTSGPKPLPKPLPQSNRGRRGNRTRALRMNEYGECEE